MVMLFVVSEVKGCAGGAADLEKGKRQNVRFKINLSVA